MSRPLAAVIRLKKTSGLRVMSADSYERIFSRPIAVEKTQTTSYA